MNDQDKTKEELLKELQELQKENNSLKALYNKYITDSKQAEQELIIANIELDFQNKEKEDRAAELGIANIELDFQNKEKEDRAAELGIANIELDFQNKEKENRAAELGIANIELDFQTEEKEKRAAELIIANKELLFQNKEKEDRAAELGIANIELDFQTEEKEKRAAELIIANKELDFQNKEKENRAAELGIANIELDFQTEEKGKRAVELIIANKELLFQNEEKEKRAAELLIANEELIFQNEEKEKRAAELLIAYEELIFQNEEKEKRAAELLIANEELIFQNKEKEKRAAELLIANEELIFQNEEKEKRAAELLIVHEKIKAQNDEIAVHNEEYQQINEEFQQINEELNQTNFELISANEELIFQNEEKEKRAAELDIANIELAFQKKEKGKRAAELLIANEELIFQNKEKEKRAAELLIANEELIFQNKEKEKRAAELLIANEELIFQNKEKEKRATELIFQNEEKEKRAAELLIANKKIRAQNDEIAAYNEEYQQINEEYQQINEELNQVNFELIGAKEKAEESDRLKSAFLANMSHEIRTPMNGILGFAELLKEPKLTGEEQQEYIGIIEKSGARMLNIINDIIDISKIESEQMEVNISVTNVNEQIEYIYTFFKPEVERKGMQIFFQNSLPEKEAIIKTDREKVYAILTNLVKNAIKYSDKGTINFGYNLKMNRELAELEFFVKDTGIGILKDRQEVVFHRFVQADISDKRAYQGAGLGLSITKAYVEMLGGKIWVESEEGKGSTFYFTIPYNTIPQEIIAIKNVVSRDKEDSQIKKLKILIAEDDATSEKLITKMVEKYCKEDLHARTGVEAVAACRNNPDIDLVLIDIQMPEMNGYEATRQIRQFNKDVIIIAQTAFGLIGDKEKSIAAGCNYYISKPIDKDLLITLIKICCDRTF